MADRMAGDASIYLAAALANGAIPFLLLPFLTRWLGPADFGLAALFFATTNVAMVFAGLNAHGVISVAYFRHGPETLAPQTGAAVGVAIMMGAILMLLAILLPDSILRMTGLPPAWLWIVALAAVFQAIQVAVAAVFQTRRKPFQYAAVQIGYGVLLAVFTIGLIGWASLGWLGRALAQLAATAFICAAALVALTASGQIHWNIGQWRMREALSFGIPLLPHAIGGVIIANIDRLVLAPVSGPETIGRYFLAVQIASIPLIIATALSQAWSPWLFSRLATKEESQKRVVVRATYAMVGMVCLISTAIGLMAQWLVPLVAGPGFELSIELLRLLAPAYAFVSMYHFVTGFLFYEQRTGLLSAITIGAAAAQFGLCSVLVRWSGPMGVALGTLIGYLLYFLTVCWFARRVHPLPWRI
jgi:O-antigen/teichoic acid export membrane protein